MSVPLADKITSNTTVSIGVVVLLLGGMATAYAAFSGVRTVIQEERHANALKMQSIESKLEALSIQLRATTIDGISKTDFENAMLRLQIMNPELRVPDPASNNAPFSMSVDRPK